jgi:hypothetical protein
MDENSQQPASTPDQQSSNDPLQNNEVVNAQPVVSAKFDYVDPPLVHSPMPYRELIKQASIALAVALGVGMPFVVIGIAIGFMHFDSPDASSAAQQALVGDIGGFIMAVAGGIYFSIKTKLKSGFVIFICAGLAAGISATVLPYKIDLAKTLEGWITVIVTVAIFTLFIVLLTRLAIARFSAVTLSIIGIPLIVCFAFTSHYYAIHGTAIKRQQSIKASVGSVATLKYQFYAPVSDEYQWTFHSVSVYTEDPFLKDHQMLNIYMDGNREVYGVLQLIEGTNKNDVLGVNGDPDCAATTIGKSNLGHLIYAEPESCNNQSGYYWAATKIGVTYVTASYSDTTDNPQPLSFYTSLFDSLKPINKNTLATKLLTKRT